jgi:hypothetical protein
MNFSDAAEKFITHESIEHQGSLVRYWSPSKHCLAIDDCHDETAKDTLGADLVHDRSQPPA